VLNVPPDAALLGRHVVEAQLADIAEDPQSEAEPRT
jgi:hypothetical protein